MFPDRIRIYTCTVYIRSDVHVLLRGRPSKGGSISGLLPPLSHGSPRLLTTFSANLEEVSIIAYPESFNCAENQQRAVQIQSFCDVTKGVAERLTTPQLEVRDRDLGAQDGGLHATSHR